VAEELYAVAKRRIRQTLHALAEAIGFVGTVRGRKAVVLYSEGFIKSPSMPDYDRVIERAQRAQVAVYVVDPRGLESGLPTPAAATNRGRRGPLLALDTEAAGSSYSLTLLVRDEVSQETRESVEPFTIPSVVRTREVP